MEAHRGGVAVGQDEARGLACLGADGAKDVGRGRPLILRRHGPGAASGPAPGDLVLLAHSGLISEPDLYGADGDALLARDFLQAGGEAVLKDRPRPPPAHSGAAEPRACDSRAREPRGSSSAWPP